ncbi:hypothetical protein HPB47_003955 [Ixodes persulcatus]|uniref:Uncharacterized protein n=1 Tax=Ixodes persulcatus TaxID=34615 RepID=A0AC60PI47_IXOPE|nr:hypothetical protein HPB47_003955 [Ixodes persulcatus]
MKLGMQNLLYQELLESEPVKYRRLRRVNSNQFADIFSSIASCIQNLDTEIRPAIKARDKLQLTLRFLPLGESQHSLSRQFHISHSAVNGFLVETSYAIHKFLGQKTSGLQ